MNWKFSIKNNSKSRDVNLPACLLVLLLAFILSSCANIKDYIPDMEMPDIELQDFVIEDTSDKKERLSKLTLPLKETNFIFSPIISLIDLNNEGVQKNKFFLAGQIYSKDPEESVSSLSSDNCFSPRDQDSIYKLERLYHVFIKDLGLNSVNANELEANDNIGAHFLIQPVLLKYQYCKRAYVEIRYLIQTDTGTQTARTIKTSLRAQNFKFPKKEEHHPFFSYDHPRAQFPELRHALTMAFYKNTMDLLEIISEEHKVDEAK